MVHFDVDFFFLVVGLLLVLPWGYPHSGSSKPARSTPVQKHQSPSDRRTVALLHVLLAPLFPHGKLGWLVCWVDLLVQNCLGIGSAGVPS